jgi:hypothetical protein
VCSGNGSPQTASGPVDGPEAGYSDARRHGEATPILGGENVTGEQALKRLLARYIKLTRRAEVAGRHERAECYRLRRDRLSRLAGFRAKMERLRTERTWRDSETNMARQRLGNE